MTKKELEKRVQELEQRVQELEQQPKIHFYPVQPLPYNPYPIWQRPHYPNPYPWPVIYSNNTSGGYIPTTTTYVVGDISETVTEWKRNEA